MYFVYLDEFGHIGRFIDRNDPRFNDSPVFGFAGYILPANQVRSFGTWFYQLKCHLLAFEIQRDGAHAATWEKKGSSLYTTLNVAKYRELRVATNRILNKIEGIGGHVFYVGVNKVGRLDGRNPKLLYMSVLQNWVGKVLSLSRKVYLTSAPPGMPGGAFVLAISQGSNLLGRCFVLSFLVLW